MKNLVLSVLGIIFALTLMASAEVMERSNFGVEDLKPEDKSSIETINRQIQDTEKDMEILQAKMDLDKAKIQRISEVVIPNYINDIRKKYGLPESEWKVTLNPFGFKKSVGPTLEDKKDGH